MPTTATESNYESESPRRERESTTPAAAQPRPGQGQPLAKSRLASDLPGLAADLASVQDFLQLLARAVRQFHTYPPTSPMCIDAIAASRNSLVSLQTRDRVAFRVTPHELVVDDTGLGAGTVIEHELVRRLHRSRVGTVDVDRAATPRDLARFCEHVSKSDDYTARNVALAEVLAEQGVDAVSLQMAHRPEVLNVGVPRAPLCDLVEAERRRREHAIADGPVNHLYPPDKGWVRLDPAAAFDTVSLIDLTILVEDPAQVATMLLRLTDDEPVGPEAGERALEQKFSDVALLFSSLDPRLARLMFAKLARAVLDLEPDRRTELLRRTILPGLLDGRADGAVLRDFPDLDLAESLFLLLDLETAAPEVLTTALDRLDLPADRRQTVVPLLEKKLRTGEGPARPDTSELGIDKYAKRLIRIDAVASKNFAEYSAFDLSIDEQAISGMANVREAMAATDIVITQLGCLANLVRIEPNPTVVDGLLERAQLLFVAMEREERWRDLAAEIQRYRQIGDALTEHRPDVAAAVLSALGRYCTPERVAVIGRLAAGDAQARAIASAFIEAFGAAVAPALVTLVDAPGGDAKNRALGALVCEHAKLLAPALAPHLGQAGPASTRMIVRLLGHAGHGYESAIASQVGRDEQTDREAMRALARLGTPQAAAIVTHSLRESSGRGSSAAEEALWHFPPALAAAQLREMLGSRDFVLQRPQLVARLLERAGQAGGVDALAPILAGLAPLRFRFWNPAVVRVAKTARRMMKR